MQKDLTLTVVDQSPVREGGSARDALTESVRLAQAAEAFGFHRYWVTEHHSSHTLAGTSPEILIGQIAANTQSIHVGSAGVMLSHYSALKVAEQFRILSAFYPGRIGLGIGRAPGSDGRTAQALAYPRQMADVGATFPRQVFDLLCYLYDAMPEEHPYASIKAQPTEAALADLPEVWLLGSSDYSAQLAAHLGLRFAFADFFGRAERDFGPKVSQVYREQFKPSDFLDHPESNVTLQVFCAPTDEEAQVIASSARLLTVRRRIGDPDPRIVPPDEAMATLAKPDMQMRLQAFTGHMIVGSPETVVAGVLEAAERYSTTDIGISGNTFHFADRVRSYELIAAAFNLQRQPAPAAL